MAKLKLKGAVKWTPTLDGVLFRLGHDFLPVKGQGTAQLFARIRPYLSGRWSQEDLCRGLTRDKESAVVNVLCALRDARMLYEIDSPELDESLIRTHGPHVARLETRVSRPFSALKQWLSQRVLVVGRSEMAAPTIQACVETGIPMQAITALDEGELLLKNTSLKVAAYDALIISVDLDTAEAYLDTCRDSLRSLRSVGRVVLLTIHDNVVLAGPIYSDVRQVHLHCLMQRYRLLEEPQGQRLRVSRKAALQIGARLVVQKLFDSVTGLASVDDDRLFFELDRVNGNIKRRPAPPVYGCSKCAISQQVLVDKNADVETPVMDPDSFLARVQKYLVDEKTGLIGRLDEGALSQLPHHQSAAMWRTPQNSIPVWTTECGEEFRDARLRVIRRTLEQYAIDTVSIAFDAFPSGVVVSAETEKELIDKAFFRAVAKFANAHDGWLNVAVPPSINRAEYSDAYLTLSYLADIGELKNLAVERHPRLASTGCECLRFVYAGQVVSVACGPHYGQLWATGLKDVWLRVAARSVLPFGADLRPAVAFRGPIGISAESNDIRKSVLRSFGLQLRLAPVVSFLPELRFAEPLLWTHASVIPAD